MTLAVAIKEIPFGGLKRTTLCPIQPDCLVAIKEIPFGGLKRRKENPRIPFKQFKVAIKEIPFGGLKLFGYERLFN